MKKNHKKNNSSKKSSTPHLLPYKIFKNMADFFYSKLDFIANIPKLSLPSLVRFDKSQWQNFALLNYYGLIFGILFSAWLYAFVGIVEVCGGFSDSASMWLNIFGVIALSALGIVSIACYLLAPVRIRFYFGFFAGILLLYWIALSFRYTPFPFLIPLVWLGIGFIIGSIFWVLLFFKHIIFRIFTLVLLGSIHPFGFDWLVPQSFFAYSAFGVSEWDFLFVIVGVALLVVALFRSDINFPKKSKKSRPSSVRPSVRICVGFFGVISLALALDIDGLGGRHTQTSTDSSAKSNSQFGTKSSTDSSDLFLRENFALAQTYFRQDFKWSKSALDEIKEATFSTIEQAKTNGKKAIILPETILPIVLDSQIATLDELQSISDDIAIILGAFSKPNFNSTYIIYKGDVQILNKVILAPFGEKMPLPDFLAKPLLKLFFGIDEGLDSASAPQDFRLFERVFRNAICYEGTSKELYADSPNLVVMISNNGWFYPSIEPYLQRTLMKYYARKAKSTILHSANLSPSFILSSKVLDDNFDTVIHIKD